MNAIAAPPAICAPEKNFSDFIRFLSRNRRTVSFDERKPNAKPRSVESTIPNRTFPHSEAFMPEKLPCIATAAPVIPAMSAWLSLVGIPKYHAATAQMTIADIAAQSAISDRRASFPKSAMLYMVMATEALIAVITRTPKKLNIAAMTIALRTPIARVETQVAIAFGASVHPFTRITPSVSSADTASIGFSVIIVRKSVIGIHCHLSFSCIGAHHAAFRAFGFDAHNHCVLYHKSPFNP